MLSYISLKVYTNFGTLLQLENFAFPIVYLFFIIYQKSKVWTITRLKNLSGVYVECYRFLIFVVTDSVYYKYQYRLTYTLCSDLNSVSLYVTEIKEQPIFKRIRWQLRIFESVFYKSLIRACSFEN